LCAVVSFYLFIGGAGGLVPLVCVLLIIAVTLVWFWKAAVVKELLLDDRGIKYWNAHNVRFEAGWDEIRLVKMKVAIGPHGSWGYLEIATADRSVKLDGWMDFKYSILKKVMAEIKGLSAKYPRMEIDDQWL